mgnify:CR=1 FL=1
MAASAPEATARPVLCCQPDKACGGGGRDLAVATRVERLVAERSQCKASRDFRRADEIRDELREKYLVYVSDKDRTWRRTTGRRRERKFEAYARLPDEEGAPHHVTDHREDARRREARPR